jgi:hypothetical protein
MLGIVSNVGVLVADTFLIVAVGLNNRLNQTLPSIRLVRGDQRRPRHAAPSCQLAHLRCDLGWHLGAERYPRLGRRLRARGLRGHQRGDKVFRRDGDATKFQVLRGDASSVVLRRFTDWPDLKADLSAEG